MQRKTISTKLEKTHSLNTLSREADEFEVSVVIPCLNEAENIEQCVTTALKTLNENNLVGEVVVADNGSTDDSAKLAVEAGARVVHEERRGYGSAYLAGLAAANGTYIVMADADLTYDFREIPRFIKDLRDGAQMVIGNRMKNIQPGAMPWLHQYIGNPVLTGILNFFFRTGIDDAHCGMRALRRDVLPILDLRTTGMEFASEMVIRAAKEKLVVRQFPIDYHPRGGESKLSSFRDGWRHLRFLLVHSPTHLFLLPGLLLSLLGSLMLVMVLTQVEIFGRQWELHTMIGGALFVTVGIQIAALGICAHTYGVYFMNERDEWFLKMRQRFRLENGLLLGGIATFAGISLAVYVLWSWVDRGFGALSDERLAILAATLITVGLQIFFTSFLLSILGLRGKVPDSTAIKTND